MRIGQKVSTGFNPRRWISMKTSHRNAMLFLTTLTGASLFASLPANSSAMRMTTRDQERVPQGQPSAPPQWTQEERARLLSARLLPIHDTADLPQACKKAFASLTREPSFSLANPRTHYQSTDVRSTDGTLPRRRLVAAGASKDRCVIHYEIGGIATRYAVVVIDISHPERPAWIWGSLNAGHHPDWPTLIERVASDKLGQGDRAGW